MSALSIDRLHEVLAYDPETGCFTWLERSGEGRGVKIFNSRCAGKLAGALCSVGYYRLRVDGQEVLSHRAAFAMIHGRWPVLVDHINGDKTDNRAANLRECSGSQNNYNQRKRDGCISSFKGAYRNGKRWIAQITIAGQRLCLGSYDSDAEAARAYDAAAAQYHGEFAYLNFPGEAA